MHFSHPWLLALLIIPITLAWLSIKSSSAFHRRQSVSFSALQTALSTKKSLRQFFLPLPGILILLALSLIIIAIAGPQHGMEEIRSKRSGVAIEMLFDISSSMDINLESSDASFERITAAKKVCRDFIIGNSEGLSGRHNDVIGLITFARYADTACPMTTSLPALAAIVDELEIENRPNEDGTAFGDAMVLAAAHLMKLDSTLEKNSSIKSKIIILLTDGDNNCGRHLPQQAAALAKKWGIKIYAIFIGEAPPKSKPGAEQILSGSQKQLQKICKSTGGICRMVYDYDSLNAVYAEIDSLEKSRINLFTDVVYREIFQIFALAALLCLLGAIILDSTILRRVP